jgi:hypothetical protein
MTSKRQFPKANKALLSHSAERPLREVLKPSSMHVVP